MGGFSTAQAVIAAMVTPALLIMASSSLIATVLVRLARVVDRVRKVAETAQGGDPAELDRNERRALLSERALLLLFAAVISFVVAGFVIAIDHAAGDAFWWLPVAVTTAGMTLLVAGSAAMLSECRLGVAQIRAEISAARRSA